MFQYINGQRGPRAFPPLDYQLAKGAPVWAWSAVSRWMADNHIIRDEQSSNAEVIAAINNWLESARQRHRNPELIKRIARDLKSV